MVDVIAIAKRILQKVPGNWVIVKSEGGLLIEDMQNGQLPPEDKIERIIDEIVEKSLKETFEK